MTTIDLPVFAPDGLEFMPLDELRDLRSEGEKSFERLDADLTNRIASSRDLVSHVKSEHPSKFNVTLTVVGVGNKKAAETFKAEGVTAADIVAHVQSLAVQATKGDLLTNASDKLRQAQVQLETLRKYQNALRERWRTGRQRLYTVISNAERREASRHDAFLSTQ